MPLEMVRSGFVLLAISFVTSSITPTLAQTKASAATQAQCSKWVGRTAELSAFDDVVAPFAGVTPKDEFETTAEYEARRAKTVGQVKAVVLPSMTSLKHVEYNADSRELIVKEWAFHNFGLFLWEDVYSAGLHGKVNVDVSENAAFVSSGEVQEEGTYKAKNRLGLEVEVTKSKRTVKAVFDPPQKTGLGRRLFPNSKSPDYILGRLKMTADDARAIKPSLSTAFAVEPRPPYLMRGFGSVVRPTVSNPKDVMEDFTILIANIQCGLLLNRDRKVLAAYSTN